MGKNKKHDFHRWVDPRVRTEVWKELSPGMQNSAVEKLSPIYLNGEVENLARNVISELDRLRNLQEKYSEARTDKNAEAIYDSWKEIEGLGDNLWSTAKGAVWGCQLRGKKLPKEMEEKRS